MSRPLLFDVSVTEDVASGGVSTPGHGKGEGPARYKLFAEQMTQEMVGGAGAELRQQRSGVLRRPHPPSLK